MLTQEQEKLVDDYALLMLKNGVKCGTKTNKTKAKVAVAHLYQKYLDVAETPKTVFVASPEEAIAKASKLTGVPAKDLAGEILWVNWWTWWVAYYHAGVTLLKESAGEELDGALLTYEDITRNVHAVLPCEGTCFVIEYPKKVSIKDGDLDKFVLHRDGGLALEYQDGTGFAWLNGIEVPDWVAKTPASKLSVKKLMAEQNTDVKREGLKRVGITKALKAMKAKMLDRVRGRKKWESYDLLEADFGDKKRVFLKMVNPSTGDTIIEQVTDTCKTVAEAHAMRSRETKYIEPLEIT